MTDWSGAACVGWEALFDEAADINQKNETHPIVRSALEVCAACPIRAACLDMAMSMPGGVAGVWGATTQAQRKRHGHGYRVRALDAYAVR